ncbi:helix-turn-helix domain-containing protein [Streptomyces sp. Je 1-369]|uniref:helix-turn-helix domain-containing protein n=1 Tax=Streptomyces sp. Je 1-369 TaxID=2966192 RepID=UPI0022853C22|nr:helix-turn-helix transcriptional regulator [Streptomyces sp. Je 1-369]WAL95551.1 helix-turn-helix domain-containing protein [Streptomyces sp. Je 1-369]
MNRSANLGNRASTVLGRKLGGELLRLRDASGKTQHQAAQTISATNSKIVKMEQGWVPIRDPDIRVLCEFYEVRDLKSVARLLELARLDRERRKAKGWWQHAPQAGAMAEYIAMEDVATRVRTWQQALVPGLLQTPEYTRALAVSEGLWEDPDEIEGLVDVRMKRQARLSGPEPLQFYAVIGESALRQQVGGPDVMRAQLQHLLTAAQLPNVHVQVLPFRAGSHACIAGSFSIVSFAETEAMDVVHVDSIAATVWIENDAESAMYRTFFERTARLSLAPRDSLSLIETISEDMHR